MLLKILSNGAEASTAGRKGMELLYRPVSGSKEIQTMSLHKTTCTQSLKVSFRHTVLMIQIAAMQRNTTKSLLIRMPFGLLQWQTYHTYREQQGPSIYPGELGWTTDTNQ